MSTATPSRGQVRQDVMPSSKIKPYRNMPFNLPYNRGPAGWILLGAMVGVMGVGHYLFSRSVEDKRYRELAKQAERFERAQVLQAIEDASYAKREKRRIDSERALMADQPTWTVNKSIYMTQKQERPAYDPLYTATHTVGTARLYGFADGWYRWLSGRPSKEVEEEQMDK